MFEVFNRIVYYLACEQLVYCSTNLLRLPWGVYNQRKISVLDLHKNFHRSAIVIQGFATAIIEWGLLVILRTLYIVYNDVANTVEIERLLILIMCGNHSLSNTV